jgi:tRNA threonylcarbamoyladenosine biosynthesis protein TsaB
VLLLALDTSSAAVTAALHDGAGVLAEEVALDARRHAELLAPAITRVLARAAAGPADLTGIVVGVGPGPFTGLRVGVVTARVLGATLGVPVHAVCSLDALAEGALAEGSPAEVGDFLVATDARRREVYWARYGVERGDRRWAVRRDGPHVGAAADLPRHGLVVVGRGAVLYPEVLGPARAPLEAGAGYLAAVAVRALTGGDPRGVLLPAVPLYLRRPDATEPGARKRVLR